MALICADCGKVIEDPVQVKVARALHPDTEDESIYCRCRDCVNRSIIWQEYLWYLKKWIQKHDESDNYGLSPSCFEEWYIEYIQVPEEE